MLSLVLLFTNVLPGSDTDLPSVVTSLFFLPETGLIEARTEFLCQVIG